MLPLPGWASGKKDTGEGPGSGKQEGRVSFSCSSMHLPPAAEIKSRHGKYFPASSPPFHPALSLPHRKSEKVTKHIIHHGI